MARYRERSTLDRVKTVVTLILSEPWILVPRILVLLKDLGINVFVMVWCKCDSSCFEERGYIFQGLAFVNAGLTVSVFTLGHC